MQPWEDGPDLALPRWRGRWVEGVLRAEANLRRDCGDRGDAPVLLRV